MAVRLTVLVPGVNNPALLLKVPDTVKLLLPGATVMFPVELVKSVTVGLESKVTVPVPELESNSTFWELVGTAAPKGPPDAHDQWLGRSDQFPVPPTQYLSVAPSVNVQPVLPETLVELAPA